MPQFDLSIFASQLFWLAICFSILYGFMSLVFLPRIKNIINFRQDNIANNKGIAAEIQKKIDALRQNSEELRTTALDNYKTAIDQAVKRAAIDRDQALSNAKNAIEKMTVHSEQRIATFMTECEDDIKNITAKIVDVVSAKIFGDNSEAGKNHN